MGLFDRIRGRLEVIPSQDTMPPTPSSNADGQFPQVATPEPAALDPVAAEETEDVERDSPPIEASTPYAVVVTDHLAPALDEAVAAERAYSHAHRMAEIAEMGAPGPQLDAALAATSRRYVRASTRSSTQPSATS
jgi:hypothetical protein